ncbi:hypothetical protein FOA52_005490 [Chlamydomonas sp. UWO 241]|nr:hypothetical protein FOA52_005490 [Chlamydomonas sp. UWO 241]
MRNGHATGCIALLTNVPDPSPGHLQAAAHARADAAKAPIPWPSTCKRLHKLLPTLPRSASTSVIATSRWRRRGDN